MAGTIDGNLDHLTEGGLAKFLHCLVIPPALSTKLSLGERVLEGCPAHAEGVGVVYSLLRTE